MSEQEPVQAATAVQATGMGACPHPEAIGKRWGDPISEARQAELQGYLERWQTETDHGDREGPFDKLEPSDIWGVTLTSAEVSWLTAQLGLNYGTVMGPILHLEGADLHSAHLEGADLSSAHLEGANLVGVHLAGAELYGVHLEGASLDDAHLEGANLWAAYLEVASLTGAFLDKTTTLTNAILTGVTLDQITIDNTNLSVVDWRAVPRLGDELQARRAKDGDGTRKNRRTRLDEYRAAVRANRRLAVALQANGLSEDASRYYYRAQLLQRASLLYEGRIAQWLGSWILAGLAGYGYRPARTILLYVGILITFAALYLNFGMVDGHAFNITEAAVFSVTSFHGRGFFPGGLRLDDPVTIFAAVEAVIGLVIEVSFIATFTQRFFNLR